MNKSKTFFFSKLSSDSCCRKYLAILGKIILIGIILTVCLSIRVHFNNIQPLAKRHFYSKYYAPVLFYMAGKGMNSVNGGLSGVQGKESISKDLINDFLELKSNELSLKTVKTFIDENPNTKFLPPQWVIHPLGGFVTAWVWKLFGISWKVLFYFYSFLSTLACLAIFFVARKICHSFLGGVFAALVYAFAIPELFGGVWSIRDACPTWFFAYAACFLFCFTGVFQNRYINLVSYFFLGVVTFLGVGWRSDCLLFFPVVALTLVILLIQKWKNKKYSTRKVLICFVVFVVGIAFTYISINSLQGKPNCSFGFMHIAQYAEVDRCRIGNYENNFQNQWNDSVTSFQAKYYSKKNFPDQGFSFMQGNYGQICLYLYLLQFQHNCYQWVRTYPDYFFNCFLFNDVSGVNIEYFGYCPYSKFKDLWFYCVCLAFFGGLFLFIIGIWRTGVAFFLGFIFYYSLVYWAILPRLKHIMIVSIPISILAGISIYWLVAIFFNERLRLQVINIVCIRKRWKLSLIILCTVFCFYVISLVFTNLYCSNVRSSYFKRIDSLTLNGKNVSKHILIPGGNVFSIDLSKSDPCGLLIDFMNCGEGGIVYVLHLRNNITQSVEYMYIADKGINRHTLFTNCYPMSDKYLVTCIFPTGSKITNANLVPLDNWNGVYYAGIFNKFERPSGAKSLYGWKAENYKKRNPLECDSLLGRAKLATLVDLSKVNNRELVAELSTNEFIVSTYIQNKGKNKRRLIKKSKNGSLFWTSKSSQDHIWNKPKSFILNDQVKKENARNKIFVSIVSFAKKDFEFSGNLSIRLQYYDKEGKLTYTSPPMNLKKYAQVNGNKFEIGFIYPNFAPEKADKFRIFFIADSPGTYKIPPHINVFNGRMK